MSVQQYRASTATTESELPMEHERIVRRLFERVYSNGELSLVEELIAPDCVGFGPGTNEVYQGRDGLKSQASRLRAAIFGLTFEVDNVRGSGGNFEVHWTARGRLERPFLGVEPTCIVGVAGEEPHGLTFAETGITTGRITDGLIREMKMHMGIAGGRG